MDVVAEHRIEVLHPDGTIARVHLRVGHPYPHPQGDYACRVSAEGLGGWGHPADICGVSSLHALLRGLGFLHRALAAAVERGAVLHWEGGKDVLTLDELFAPFRPG